SSIRQRRIRSMISEERFRAKLPFRGRGHADLVQRVGGVFADIDERLSSNDVIRVLELGCGYGTVLLELHARYGKKVELHGINRNPRDGDAVILERNARERGLLVAEPSDANRLPTITFADLAGGLPFADDTFDIVYSQVAWLYFPNKIAV